VNGAAARLVQEGDIVIIISYALVPDDKVPYHEPKVAIMDRNNRIADMIHAEPESTIL
jgi:aspartate 1-decarboxylase